jgi:hypothetical protein
MEVPPTGAVSGMENVIGWLAPAARENVAEGEGVIPEGTACNEMFTVPVNPVCAVTEIVTGEVVVPTSVSTDEGETDNVKSGVGGGGGAEPPPQPISIKASTVRIDAFGVTEVPSAVDTSQITALTSGPHKPQM